MRWIVSIVLAVSLAGCGSETAPPGNVPLLTGGTGCYAGGESGQAGVLLADPKYGTTFNGMVVRWPQGFRAFVSDGVVEVVDAKGTRVARTGRTYYISFASPYANRPETIDGLEVYPAAAACGYAWDFVDCASPPTGMEDVEAKCAAARDKPGG